MERHAPLCQDEYVYDAPSRSAAWTACLQFRVREKGVWTVFCCFFFLTFSCHASQISMPLLWTYHMFCRKMADPPCERASVWWWCLCPQQQSYRLDTCAVDSRSVCTCECHIPVDWKKKIFRCFSFGIGRWRNGSWKFWAVTFSIVWHSY